MSTSLRKNQLTNREDKMRPTTQDRLAADFRASLPSSSKAPQKDGAEPASRSRSRRQPSKARRISLSKSMPPKIRLTQDDEINAVRLMLRKKRSQMSIARSAETGGNLQSLLLDKLDKEAPHQEKLESIVKQKQSLTLDEKIALKRRVSPEKEARSSQEKTEIKMSLSKEDSPSDDGSKPSSRSRSKQQHTKNRRISLSKSIPPKIRLTQDDEINAGHNQHNTKSPTEERVIKSQISFEEKLKRKLAAEAAAEESRKSLKNDSQKSASQEKELSPKFRDKLCALQKFEARSQRQLSGGSTKSSSVKSSLTRSLNSDESTRKQVHQTQISYEEQIKKKLVAEGGHKSFEERLNEKLAAEAAAGKVEENMSQPTQASAAAQELNPRLKDQLRALSSFEDRVRRTTSSDGSITSFSVKSLPSGSNKNENDSGNQLRRQLTYEEKLEQKIREEANRHSNKKDEMAKSKEEKKMDRDTVSVDSFEERLLRTSVVASKRPSNTRSASSKTFEENARTKANKRSTARKGRNKIAQSLTVAQTGSWQCQKCTFINKSAESDFGTSARCFMCNEPKNGVPSWGDLDAVIDQAKLMSLDEHDPVIDQTKLMSLLE